MTLRYFTIGSLVLCTLGLMNIVSDLAAQEPDIQPTDAAVRDSVARSLPFLEQVGTAWMDERGCMSCHHVPFMLWSHRAARTQGLAVDVDKLTEWDQWARRESLAHRNSFKLPKADLEKLDVAAMPIAVKGKLQPIVDQSFATEAEFLAKLTPLLTDDELRTHRDLLVTTAALPLYAVERSGGGLDVLGQLLLSQHGEPNEPASSEFRSGLVDLMNRMQLVDGSWTPGNQLATMRRWPLPAANQATTMWATLALAAYDDPVPKQQDHSEQVERALAWQRQQPPQPDNHEWLATRLLFERQFGPEDDVAKLHQQLLDSRNPDGGWSWSKGNPSDPYTTGLAIYVIAKVRGGDDSAAIREARSYLLTSQQSDGSWVTPSRNISDTTVPERLAARDEIYHYWGTAWSVIGLLETLR